MQSVLIKCNNLSLQQFNFYVFCIIFFSSIVFYIEILFYLKNQLFLLKFSYFALNGRAHTILLYLFIKILT